jgi:hypothetical protein
MFRPVHKGGKAPRPAPECQVGLQLGQDSFYAHHVSLDSAPSVSAERLLDQGQRTAPHAQGPVDPSTAPHLSRRKIKRGVTIPGHRHAFTRS